MNDKRPPLTIQSNLLDINQVAEFLGIAKDTIYKMVNQRRIPYTKIGRLLRFERRALDVWIHQHAVSPLPQKDTGGPELPGKQGMA